MRQPSPLCLVLASAIGLANLIAAIEPYEIQGSTPLSPYAGKTLSGIHGIVTAKGPKGWWIRGASDGNDATSDSINVYTESAAVISQVAVGDEISFTGVVSDYRGDKQSVFFTQIKSPTSITTLSIGNVVKPIVLGEDRFPPTTLYSAIDEANGGVLGYPGGKLMHSKENVPAQPHLYGLDFWSSLDGELVTIKSPVALGLDKQNSDFWVHGTWPVTGKNARGGLTLAVDANGVVDANPEAVLIGTPLQGRNPKIVTMGSTITDITGVVTYSFGFWRVLPITAPTVIAYPTTVADLTRLTSTPYDATRKCQKITFGSYNVKNLNPTSPHMSGVAEHLVKWMKSPDLLFIQEVQDDTGPDLTDDGVVSSEGTLRALTQSIVSTGGPSYSWAVVDPVNRQDGGEKEGSGNIRVVFLYRPEVLKLVNPNPGSANDATKVKVVNERPELTFNPGRIDPTNPDFNASRKPLVVLFEAIASGEGILAINVHQSSKGESSSIFGDPRPPINGAIDKRIGQARATAAFVKSFLVADPAARIVIGGDFNDFTFTNPVFEPYFANGMLEDADVVVNIPPLERYTYVFDMNSQQLDHILVSKEVAKTLEYEHLHVNTWAPSYEEQTSDHDPSVGRIELCATSEPVVRRVTEEL